MPRRVLRVSPLRGTDKRSLDAFVGELNNTLQAVQEHLSELTGLDGKTPAFSADADFGGNRIKNVARSSDAADVCSREELEENALYAKDGVHEATNPIVARGGIRSTVPAINYYDLLPLGQATTTPVASTVVYAGQSLVRPFLLMGA